MVKEKKPCKSHSRFGNKSISDGPNERVCRKYATNDADDCRMPKKERIKPTHSVDQKTLKRTLK